MKPVWRDGSRRCHESEKLVRIRVMRTPIGSLPVPLIFNPRFGLSPSMLLDRGLASTYRVWGENTVRCIALGRRFVVAGLSGLPLSTRDSRGCGGR
jgi:hypothetical protein